MNFVQRLCLKRVRQIEIRIPMRAKVKEELDRMEKAGVISKVTEPTPWCAGMVVVPKQDGAVRVCVHCKTKFVVLTNYLVTTVA